MGLILDIVNKVVPRTLDRLEKEIAYSLTDQSIGNKPMKPLQNIITDKEDIDNYGVYDKNGQTLMGVDEI
ncbi:MAG: hypothetical protein E7C50_18280 [Clostridium sp.]|uniref:hypothetical protein n=1 Tax=Clostridium sp. TaxID=1506 RepID=UPI0029043303|nr:hypothetical protein [Clostridium sp.]MDU2683805.1 hypothetical protein [Clostridium sp.]